RSAGRRVTASGPPPGAMPGPEAGLHVIELAGDDRVPVVLLHGMAAVTAAAVPLIPAFGGRRVIAPDWPGHGLSDATTIPRDSIRSEEHTSELQSPENIVCRLLLEKKS